MNSVIFVALLSFFSGNTVEIICGSQKEAEEKAENLIGSCPSIEVTSVEERDYR